MLKHKNIFLVGVLFLISLSVVADLEEMERFNWEHVLQTPPPGKTPESYQVLHFRSRKKEYTLDPGAVTFVNNNMHNAKEFISDADALRYGVDHATLDGAYIELGFCTGKSINFIAALQPTKTIYGFDSFQGLNEDWNKGYTTIRKGTFKIIDQNFLPSVLSNVKLYKGMFKDVLPKFVAEILQDKPIALLHVDCEVYSSTKEAFDALHNNIVPGTIIVFDEFYNYPAFEEHEYKALMEFLQSKNLKAEYIAFNKHHEQVVVKVIN